MQIFEVRLSTKQMEDFMGNSPDTVLSAEVDDDTGVIKRVIAHQYSNWELYSRFEQKVHPTVLIEVRGINGTRWYRGHYLRNPFVSQQKQIDEAISKAMYQYAITTDFEATQAYNAQVKFAHNVSEVAGAISLILIVGAYLWYSFKELGNWPITVGGASPILLMDVLLVISACFEFLEAAYGIGDLIINRHFGQQQVMIATILPPALTLSLLSRSLSFALYGLLVATILLGLIQLIIRLNEDHYFAYQEREARQ